MKKDYNCTRFPHRVKRALMQLSDDAKGHEMAYCFMRACFEYDDSGVKTDFADFGMNLIFADFVEFAENGKRLAQERSEIYRYNAKKRWKESRLSQEPEAEEPSQGTNPKRLPEPISEPLPLKPKKQKREPKANSPKQITKSGVMCTIPQKRYKGIDSTTLQSELLRFNDLMQVDSEDGGEVLTVNLIADCPLYSDIYNTMPEASQTKAVNTFADFLVMLQMVGMSLEEYAEAIRGRAENGEEFTYGKIINQNMVNGVHNYQK